LAEGLTLDEAGAQLGISKNTVKSRLRSIFAKTGATRQSSLIRMLLDTMVSL
jgi:DNA-binding CsgD family transcriptional regulator